MKGKKIALFCAVANDHFIKELMAIVQQDNKVKRFTSGRLQDAIQLAMWSDIAFSEWMTDVTAQLSHLKINKTRQICRLHRFEAYHPIIKDMNWKNLDDLIVVAPHMKTLIKDRVPESKQTRVTMIPPYVNMDRFTLKEENPQKETINVGTLGSLRYVKNPPLILECFKALQDRNKDVKYTFHIAGQVNPQDDEISNYFNYARESMGLDISLWGQVKKPEDYLAGLDILFTASSIEGFPVGVMEAASCGVLPLVHNFFGSEGLYPSNMHWKSIDEFIAKSRQKLEPKKYRDWARKYSVKKMHEKLCRLVAKYE